MIFMKIQKINRQFDIYFGLTGREIIFLIAAILKMIVEMMNLTVIPFMGSQAFYALLFKIMTYSSYLLVVVSFLLTPGMKTKEFVKVLIIVAITAIGSVFIGNGILLTLIYLYGAKDINVEKVFWIVGYLYIIIFILIILFSLVGVIDNWDFPQGGIRPTRWGLGFTYPTHTSSVLFMAFLIFCYLKKERMTILMVVILEVINLGIFLYTDSRAGMMLSSVTPIVFYLLKFTKKEYSKNKVGWILQFSFPLCAVITYICTMLYNGQGILEKINGWLSGRLYYSNYSMNIYGVHLFGQRIQWVGWGGIGHTQTQLSDVYNFVDSSYLKLLLENGIIVWLLIMVLWITISIYAYRNNKKYLLWALTFLAIYCTVEQWLMNLGTNPFLIFLALCIFKENKGRDKQQLPLLSEFNEQTAQQQ